MGDVQFLIVEGTIDERCWQCLEQKQASIGAVLDECRGMAAPTKRLLCLTENRGTAALTAQERPAVRPRLGPRDSLASLPAKMPTTSPAVVEHGVATPAPDEHSAFS